MKFQLVIACLLALIYSAIAVSISVDITASKDAQVTYQSKACPYPTCSNQGASTSIVIGNYEITSEGYFGFSLSSIPSTANILSAKLKLPSGFSPYGSQPITLTVNQIVDNSAWSESTIVWDNKPSFSPSALGTTSFVAPGPADPLDVTSAVSGARITGSIGFRVVTSLNVFLQSKESGNGAILTVEYEESTTGAPSCNCPTGTQCCQNICYNPSAHSCLNGMLCPLGTQRCGDSCFDPTKYTCSQTGNTLCPVDTVPCGAACIDTKVYQCCNDVIRSLSDQC